MQHPDVEVPETKPAVFGDAAKSVILVVASPRIKGYRSHPRFVTLASSNEQCLGGVPNGYQVVLTPGEDIFAVGRPADANETAVIRTKYVEESGQKGVRLGEAHKEYEKDRGLSNTYCSFR